ncbi:MAG: MucB/RseB C-terminal domain-containing protein [Pseudomonadales bacterium]|nr:MucB/RseB C-terminal domain-containing protein [Pseudomonadales bacterium]MCP5182802.1 MucB/RseB C-terminal domain-containing protein [Pseudomonadales bacterium]
MSGFLRSVVVLLGMLAMQWVFADGQVLDWLQRMREAERQVSYAGRLSWMDGEDLAVARIVHVFGADGVHEVVEPQRGDWVQLRRDGDRLSTFRQSGGDAVAGADAPFAYPFVQSLIRGVPSMDIYDVSLASAERVADRPAVCIAFAPRDDHRYARRIWLDAATALPLRGETTAANGRHLDVFELSELRLGDQVKLPESPPAEARVSATAPGGTEAPGGQDGQLDWEATWIPPGFRLTLRGADQPGAPVVRPDVAMYDDGLASFSIYVEPAVQGVETGMESRRGATVVVDQLVEAGEGKQGIVTVVGEIPPLTARRILNGMRLRSGNR